MLFFKPKVRIGIIHKKTNILSTTGMLLGSLLLLSLISSCVADVIRREPVLFRTVIIGDLIHYRSTNFCRNFCQTYQLLTEFQPEFIAFRNVLFIVVGGWTWFSRGSNSMCGCIGLTTQESKVGLLSLGSPEVMDTFLLNEVSMGRDTSTWRLTESLPAELLRYSPP